MAEFSRPRRKRNRPHVIGSVTSGSRRRNRAAEPSSSQAFFESVRRRSETPNRSSEEDCIPSSDNDTAPAIGNFAFDPVGSRVQPLKSRFQQHVQRRENEEINYRRFRVERQQQLQSDVIQNAQEEKASGERENHKIFVEKAALDASCPACGLEASACGAPAEFATVCFVSQLHILAIEVPVYKCPRCPTRVQFHIPPERAGAFGGSPVLSVDLTTASASRDRTWFDLGLLQSMSFMRQSSPRLANEAITEALFAGYRQRQGSNLPPEDTVRKQLGKTLEEYENVQFMIERKIAARLEDASLLGCCLACTYEKGEDGVPSVGSRRCHLYMDGNFRLPHLSNAGSSTRHEPPIKHRVASDQAVQEFCSKVGVNMPEARENECNEFDADAALRRSPKYDLKGVFAAFCRHGCLIKALNMTTGEKWSYATYLLNSFIQDGIIPSTFWYDINCRYKGHFLGWLSKNEDLDSGTKQMAEGIKFPLPVWHQSMHIAECQALNSFRTMEGVGRGAGEPPEAAWSHLGAYGHILQYASLPSRHAALERNAANLNDRKRDALPQLLRRMYLRAAAEKKSSEAEADALIEHAVSIGVTEDELSAVMEQPSLDGQPTEPELSWRANYVDKILEYAAMTTLTSRVSMSLLRSTQTSPSRLSAVTQKLKVELEIQRIEEDMDIEERWEEGSDNFEEAFKVLCRYQRSKLQQKIAQLVQHLLLIEGIFQRVSNRRQETKKLQQIKLRQQKKITTAAQQWFDWGELLDGHELGSKLPSQDEESILRGSYPWHSSGVEGALEALGPQLRLLIDISRRCTEEMDLVEEERLSALRAVARQLDRAEQWLKELEQEKALAIANLAEIQHNANTTGQGLEYAELARIVNIEKQQAQRLGMLKRLPVKTGELRQMQKRLSVALRANAPDIEQIRQEVVTNTDEGVMYSDEGATDSDDF